MSGVVISQTLNGMLENGCGFRTEGYSGSGVRSAEAVIRYELSMGNVDIVRFMQRNHEFLKEFTLEDDTSFWETVKDFSLEERFEAKEEAFREVCNENAPDITREILAMLSRYFGCSADKLQAVWLTDYKSVCSRYGATRHDEVDEFVLVPGEFFVISDLGEDGALFVQRRNV